MTTNPTMIQEDAMTASNIDTKESDTNNSSDPIIIHPDSEQTIDSDSDTEPEFSDALDTNDNSCIGDELTDIKNRKGNDYNKVSGLEGNEPDHLLVDDDEEYYKDAQDHEASDNDLNETDKIDAKEDEIKRRQEAEDRLTDEIKKVK